LKARQPRAHIVAIFQRLSQPAQVSAATKRAGSTGEHDGSHASGLVREEQGGVELLDRGQGERILGARPHQPD
jgi:hypothetical protein